MSIYYSPLNLKENTMEILIYGSCVSRDALEFDSEKRLKLIDYFARSSLASSMSNNVINDIPTHNIHSSFQKRMVENDLNKSILAIIKQSKYDILLVDFIDERFDLWISPDEAVCTVSNEFLSSGFNPPKNEILKSGSEQWFSYWEKGWVSLLNALNQSGNLHKLVINEVYWSKKTASDNNYLPNYSSAGIDIANKNLKRLYERIKRDISESHFIHFNSDELIGSDGHKWGKSPFHYQDNVYKKIISKLYTHNNNQYDGFVHSPHPFCDFIIISYKEITSCRLNTLERMAIKLGLSISVKEKLIIISNSSLNHSTIVSGYGYHNNKTIKNSVDKYNEHELSNGVGNYSSCLIQNERNATIFQDYFGMGSTYYSSNNNVALSSNRSHLIYIFSNIFEINTPNKNNINSKLLDHFFFSGQAFNNEMPICGIFKTPLHHKVILADGKINIVKINIDSLYHHATYEEALKAGVEELKAITKNALDALTSDNSIVCCDLSGGKDSRAALAVIMAIYGDKYYVRTNEVKNSEDLYISNKIASYFNINYIDHSNDIFIPISYADRINIWRSYFMGDYHRMGLPNRSTHGNSQTIRIGGGAGEVYRDFWNKIINKTSLNEVSQVLNSLLEKELALITGLQQKDKDSLSDYIKESFHSDIESNDSFISLSEHYLKFRNRSHFGMRHFSTFHDAIYVFPLLSPSLLAASSLLSEKDRENGRLMYDIIDYLNPVLNQFEYDGGFPLAERLVENVLHVDTETIEDKNKEWVKANELLKASQNTDISINIENTRLNDLLDYEVSQSLTRIKFSLNDFNDFVDFVETIYNKYEKSKRISEASTRATASTIFSIDDALHPLQSKKDEVIIFAKEKYGNDFINPILTCAIKNLDGRCLVSLTLKKTTSSHDYNFAYYIMQDGVRLHTLWYTNKTEHLLDIEVAPNVTLIAFAKNIKSGKVFVSNPQ